jgi:hypothetical protein
MAEMSMNGQAVSNEPADQEKDTQPLGSDDLVSPVFFPVSISKLIVMSVVTFSFYQFYWFYKNWSLIKKNKNRDIKPFWRTLFVVFFCYPCFKEIRMTAENLKIERSFAAGWLAVGWIIFASLHNLPDPYWIVTFFAVFFLVPIQSVANEINEMLVPGCDKNRRFTAWNIIAIVIGGLLFIAAILSSFAPPEPIIEPAAIIQQKYWTPNPDEKKSLLEKGSDDLGWEQALRLLHLTCLELLSDGSCKEQFIEYAEPAEVPLGDDRELILKLITRLSSEGSPCKPRLADVWQGKADGSNMRNSDLQGLLHNASLTHLGCIEVIRLDDIKRPSEMAFIPLGDLKDVVLDRPALFRHAELIFKDGRPDEKVILPLLYGISWFSPYANDQDGSFTRFICSLQPKEDRMAFSIGVGHQDFFIESGGGTSLLGLGSIGKISIINSK